MACPITITKFVGTISLGLLTGTSYTLINVLPSLALLPSASLAARTLTTIQTQSTRQILTLASISSLSLITAYTLAPARGKHPYLLWTALVSFLGGQGVEYWYNGLSRFPSVSTSRSGSRSGGAISAGRVASPATSSDSGYIEVEPLGQSEEQVNGEKVELEMSRERKVQKVRSWIAGLGFAMGVIGIWGDGV